MRALAAHALRALAPRVAPEAIVVLTAGAEIAPLEALLASGAPGARLLWDPRGHGEEEWAFSGRGVAAEVRAAGPSRVARLRAQGAALLGELVALSDARGAEAPAPALFGGLAFAPGSAGASPWEAFGDASFVLPRWVYARRGERAFLRLALRGEELRDHARVLAEIDAVLDALARPLPAADPPPRVRLDELSPAAWAALVDDALAGIRAGAFEKVVAARCSRLEADARFDLVAALRRAEAQPGCLRFAFERGEAVFVGATPERLVRCAAGRVETEALAGTRARRPGGDDFGVRALLASDKDRREHALVVQGIRAALAPLCEAIDAPAEPSVRTLRHVHHLCTPIVAAARGTLHALDAVEALHPTPAVCGLPRALAAAWIAAREPCPRGWYAAPVGWFDGAGDGVFAVAIRAALLRERVAWLYAGAGLVAGSDPAREYDETRVKQAAMLAVLGVEA
jgi:isochorismate synthase